MSRDSWEEHIDQISMDVRLPPDAIDRGVEKRWRTAEFLVASVAFVGLVYIAASLFWTPVRWSHAPESSAGMLAEDAGR